MRKGRIRENNIGERPDPNPAPPRKDKDENKELINVMIRTIDAQAEYIKFLSDYIDSLSVYLHIHHMSPKDDMVKKAEICRDEISQCLGILKKLKK